MLDSSLAGTVVSTAKAWRKLRHGRNVAHSTTRSQYKVNTHRTNLFIAGRILFCTFQIGNQVLYLPLLIENISLALEYLSGYALGGCSGIWKIIVFFIVFMLVNIVKTWHHVAAITYTSFTIAILQAFVLIPYASVHYQDDIQEAKEYTPAQLFGSPGATWHSVGVAMGTIAFALTPIFISVEMMNDMEQPEQIINILETSILIDLSLYLVAGASGAKIRLLNT
jgi:hypothetical protein